MVTTNGFSPRWVIVVVVKTNKKEKGSSLHWEIPRVHRFFTLITKKIALIARQHTKVCVLALAYVPGYVCVLAFVRKWVFNMPNLCVRTSLRS